MNRPQLEQLIRDSLTQSPETHVHMLSARIRELEAQAVVVPDLEDGDDAWQDAAFKGVNYSAGLRDGYNLAKSRACAIPADRVLGDGEVKMEICERDCREDDEDALEVLRVCGYGQQAEMLEAAIKAHDLRANQGGASA